MKYIGILFLTGLVACSYSSNTPSDTNDEDQEIIGSWITDCYQSNSDPEPVWSIATYHITDTEITHTYTNYDDSGCTVPYSGLENLWEGYEGTYIRLNNVSTTSGVDAAWIEVTSTVVSENDLVVEIGLYRNEDSLFPVLEDEGLYHIAQLEYFRQ